MSTGKVEAREEAVAPFEGIWRVSVADEGKLVAAVAPEIADRVHAAMRAHPLGAESRVIGESVQQHAGMVLMNRRWRDTGCGCVVCGAAASDLLSFSWASG